MSKHIYPLVRQKEDSRDIKHAAKVTEALPTSVDLRSKCPAVFDQGDLGSCTANAGVGAHMVLKGTITDADVKSRLFQYYNERVIENTVGEDSGAEMRDIGKAMYKYGICLESTLPYYADKFADTPSDACYTEGANYKIASYKSVTGVDGIRQYIAEKQQPVMIGIDVYDSFESEEVAKTGIVPVPDKTTESLLGGHAVLAVGYDDNYTFEAAKVQAAKAGIVDEVIDFLEGLFGVKNKETDNLKGALIVRNSWGADWGQKGYFYLPYAFVTSGFAYDFWTIQ